MPVGWLTMGTPEDLADLLGRDPDAFEDEVDRRVTDAGATVLNIFWSQAGKPAYVIVAVPERTADQVYATLEDVFETRVTRLWNIHELKRHRP